MKQLQVVDIRCEGEMDATIDRVFNGEFLIARFPTYSLWQIYAGMCQQRIENNIKQQKIQLAKEIQKRAADIAANLAASINKPAANDQTSSGASKSNGSSDSTETKDDTGSSAS